MSPLPSRSRQLSILLTVSCGFIMAMLDVTVVNVALSDIQRDFSVRLASLVWVVDSYTLTFAALLLLGGALADRVGARRVYMLGLVLFICASALCGAAGSVAVLIAARLVQGMAAALFVPSSLSLLTESFEDRHVRAKIVGIWSAIVSVAFASGPLVGGVLVHRYGWRSIFYLNLPVGLVGIALAFAFLRVSRRKSHALDMPSHALVMIALAALSFVLIEGPGFGWSSPAIIGSALLVPLVLMLAVIRERRSSTPVIPAGLARNGTFWALNGIGACMNVVVFGEIFVLSLFIQKVDGESALGAGVRMLPVMAVFAIANFCSGHLSARLGSRKLLLGGIGLAAIASLAVALLGTGLPLGWLIVPIALVNLGVGFAVPAMTATVMHEAGQRNANIGAAVLNANRQIGALAGVAGLGIVQHLTGDWARSLRIGFAIFVACLAIACMLAWWRVHAAPKKIGELCPAKSRAESN
jgi:DHA2 family methylenomycin A resistance protein-like MFS transporter